MPRRLTVTPRSARTAKASGTSGGAQRVAGAVSVPMSASGVRVEMPRQLMRPEYVLKATPAAAGEPRLWLLGSSMYSAHLAAAKGLPYVFAHHFAGQGTEEALATYREEFQPSDLAAEPVTFMTVNASVAPTAEEAHALLLPQLVMMSTLRTGKPLRAVDLVEEAEQMQFTAQESAIIEDGRARAVVGAPAEAAEQVREIAEHFGVDEVMINPVGSAFRGTAAASAPARVATLELLAKELF